MRAPVSTHSIPWAGCGPAKSAGRTRRLDARMPSSFSDLGLRPPLLVALEQMGFREMTPIQAAALPAILEGADVTGQAQTGSGKTAAFGLGLLQRIDPSLLAAQALVLCPTRELADQVAAEIRRLAQRLSNTRVVTVCGGRPMADQRKALERGAQVIVGTPGRVADHLQRGSLRVESLGIVVLDEADRMLDMGFADEVRGVVDACPPSRQTLLFSATFPDGIEALALAVQRDPVSIAVQALVQSEQLEQLAYIAEGGDRGALLARVLAHHRPDSALIFCETRRDCDQIARFLSARGAYALALHGALEQRERDDVLVQFSNGSVRLLVATNVAARGLDIETLPAVIVAELSPDPPSHIHRIGRTGRAGAAGLAISLVCGPAELSRLERIEALLGEEIARGQLAESGSALGFLAPEFRTVLLRVGRKDKVRKGDVLGALIKEAGLSSEDVGQIRLGAKDIAVAVRTEAADRAMAYLRSGRVKGKRPRAILLGAR